MNFTGTAGQSFGAWNIAEINLSLIGDANDYVGKGMTGGEIVIRPANNAKFIARDASIIGNTVLYGATGGKLFACGRAGERFAVRNSGAIAVIEGAGDHCCEYMTGGVVIVLGTVGVNFGAGMTGGFAYVLDIDGSLPDRYNPEHIELVRITNESKEPYDNYLYALLSDYVTKTNSEWGQYLLNNYRDYLPKFWLVVPASSNRNDLINMISAPN